MGSCEYGDKNTGFVNAEYFFIIWDIISFSRRTLAHRISPNGASHRGRLCCSGYKANRILQLCSSSYRLRSQTQTNIFYRQFSIHILGSTTSRPRLAQRTYNRKWVITPPALPCTGLSFAREGWRNEEHQNPKTNFATLLCDSEQESARRTGSHTEVLTPTNNYLSGAENKKQEWKENLGIKQQTTQANLQEFWNRGGRKEGGCVFWVNTRPFPSFSGRKRGYVLLLADPECLRTGLWGKEANQSEPRNSHNPNLLSTQYKSVAKWNKDPPSISSTPHIFYLCPDRAVINPIQLKLFHIIGYDVK